MLSASSALLHTKIVVANQLPLKSRTEVVTRFRNTTTRTGANTIIMM